VKILIIEDEKELSDSICSYLGNENYVCETAADYRSGLDKLHEYEYSCVILDIGLPGGSGLDILREIKKDHKQEGVLIISAKNSVDDKITGLRIGADDYLTKPFHLAELGARVAAIIRRKSFDGKNEIVFDQLTLSLHDKTLKGANGHSIALTRKEYDLLLYLISNKNKVVTKESIIEHLWGDAADMASSYDFIYTHIKNVRKKLQQAECPDYIQVVYGMGYKFAVR
jgi:DNA-binding response OmpR family regulator